MPDERSDVGLVKGGTVELSLLDGFRIALNGRPLFLPASAQRVLAFVALRDRPSPRLRVASTLWPETSEGRAQGNLRSALWRLRKECADAVAAVDRYLAIGREVAVDVHQMTALAHQLADGNGEDGGATLPPELFAGELLPDWYEDWVLIERERVRQLALHAMEALCDQLIRSGKYREAVEAASVGIRQEPLRESLQRLMIQALAAEGNYADAMRHYRDYEATLRDELRLDPSPRMAALVRSLTRR